MERIYLDNCATSWPKAPELGKVMADYIENDCVNTNRTESSKSIETFSWLFDLRMKICSIYNYENPECVVFTKNVTESLNWVIKGLIKKGDKVAISGWEHNSVVRPLVQIGAEYSIFTDNLNVITDTTKAVIVNPASNVSGRILDIEKIAETAFKHGCLLIIDAAQATPYIELDMKKLHSAAICFTGHKGLLGPQGTGGFVLRKDLAKTMQPLMTGGTGTQSDSFEIPSTLPERFTCGTENLVGLKGLYHSVDYVLSNKEELHKSIKKNTEYLYRKLECIPGIRIIGPGLEEERTSVISIVCKDKDIADLASFLSKNGVETRVGLHCSPLAHKSEGTFPEGTLRLSPGPFTTEEEIDYACKVISDFLK